MDDHWLHCVAVVDLHRSQMNKIKWIDLKNNSNGEMYMWIIATIKWKTEATNKRKQSNGNCDF